MVRKIIQIDEEKCNGCGACAAACHEGAIGMVDGKAKLLRDDYCDGLGDCLPACPTGAITFVEREAAAYDEEAVKAKSKEPRAALRLPGEPGQSYTDEKGSAGSRKRRLRRRADLSQWPVQIKLIPVRAPYFQGAHLLIAADCAAYAYGDFHRAVYPRPDHTDRLPQAGRRGLCGKADCDHPRKRDQERHSGAHGGALLRRN